MIEKRSGGIKLLAEIVFNISSHYVSDDLVPFCNDAPMLTLQWCLTYPCPVAMIGRSKHFHFHKYQAEQCGNT